MDNIINKSNGLKCPCPHHKVIPSAIMIVGFAMIVDQLAWYPGLTYWAIGVALVVIGCVKFTENNCKCC